MTERGNAVARRETGGNVSRVRVLLVDDNDDFLDGVSAWLAHEPQLEIAGRAHTGRKALEQVDLLRPDLVLMDVTVPDMNGFEAARRIKSRDAAPLVVLLAFHDSQTAQLEAWAAGADAFVDKAEVTERLMPIVRELIRRRHSEGKESKAASFLPTQGSRRDLSD